MSDDVDKISIHINALDPDKSKMTGKANASLIANHQNFIGKKMKNM